MSKLFLGLSGWDWLEIFSLSIVFLGAGAAFFLRLKKPTAAPDKNGLIPVELFLKKEQLEKRRSRWEYFWEGVLVLGLICEIPATTHSISESARLNNANLVLQTNVLALVASAKDRTISDVESNLFILSVKDYPKTPIKVFVGIEDNETDRYARKIRQMLDAAGYGDNGADIIRNPDGIVIESRGAEGIFSTNALVFVSYGAKGDGTFFPLFFTNNPIVKLYWARSAFSKIHLDGIFIKDDTLLKSGEVGIIVPLKNH